MAVWVAATGAAPPDGSPVLCHGDPACGGQPLRRGRRSRQLFIAVAEMMADAGCGSRAAPPAAAAARVAPAASVAAAAADAAGVVVVPPYGAGWAQSALPPLRAHVAATVGVAPVPRLAPPLRHDPHGGRRVVATGGRLATAATW